MAQINIRIPDEDKIKLEQIAQEEDRNISWLVRKAIQMYLEGRQTIEIIEED